MELTFSYDILHCIKRALKEDIIYSNHFAYPELGVTRNNLNGNVLAQPSKRADVMQTHSVYYWGHSVGIP